MQLLRLTSAKELKHSASDGRYSVQAVRVKRVRVSTQSLRINLSPKIGVLAVIRADQRFAVVGDLLRQQLGLAPAESLFLYCNSAFAPPPDELVRDVAQCFAVEGVLVLNYCTTPAWG